MGVNSYCIGKGEQFPRRILRCNHKRRDDYDGESGFLH